MGKREKTLKPNQQSWDCENDDGEPKIKPATPVVLLSSDDDDAEANEDLSLRIVEKAIKLRAQAAQNGAILHEPSTGVGGYGFNPNDAFLDGLLDEGLEHVDGINLNGALLDELNVGGDEGGVIDQNVAALGETTVVMNVKGSKKKKREKNKNTEAQIFTFEVAKEEEKAESGKDAAIDEFDVANPVNISDNIVLRKLLRGPRYFDPPDSGWGTCYNCGEEGHKTVNCTSAKRRRPCFVCGSFEHNAKQCAQGKYCFICKGGHRAKDCPEKHQEGSHSSKICLKCGESGHDMFLCKNEYSPDDLKKIQCYVCKSYGHLCCVKNTDTGSREFSCYKCGQSGHTGLACRGSNGETSGAMSISSCYRCGEEGHFARECPSLAKGSKRRSAASTPKKNYLEDNKDNLEVRSVPDDMGKVRKRNKTKHEQGLSFTHSAISKSKHRGSWATEDPGNFSFNVAQTIGWRSPVTPAWVPKASAGNHVSGSRSFRSSYNHYHGSSASNGSDKHYHHRFSASRSAKHSYGGTRRKFDW